MQGSGMITPTLQVKAGSPLHTKEAKNAGHYLQLGGSAPPALGGSRERSLDLFPALGAFAPNFAATKADLSDVHLEDWRGQRVVLNIFPSVDTGVCAASVRRFNAEAAALENTAVLCLSKDLPFALNCIIRKTKRSAHRKRSVHLHPTLGRNEALHFLQSTKGVRQPSERPFCVNRRASAPPL